MQTNSRIVIVDDEERILDLMKMTLLADGYSHVKIFQHCQEAITYITDNRCDVVVLDIMMHEMSGIEVLKRIKENNPDICAIMATGVNEVGTAVECMKAGAMDYIVKPLEPERLLASIATAVKLRLMSREYEALSERMLSNELKNPAVFKAMVTRSEKMFTIFKYIEAVAPTIHPVLITGETGTGKELAARAIHDASGLKGKFVAVNAAGLDDTMFSDSLFGHSKGAFTGADSARQGLIETAAGGTLFLDEIGDLSMQSQVKLLRLIQEREFYAVGADTPRKCTARVVTATCQDIERLHCEGRMRKDLFYRLRTHHIHLPPLRERKEDLEPLLFSFVNSVAQEQNKPCPTTPPELLDLLFTWHFPGNIRELEGMVLNAVSLHKDHVLSTKSFREHMGVKTVVGDVSVSPSASAIPIMEFPQKLPTLEQVETLLVNEAMKRAQGNQSIAASLLGIARQSLGYRLKKSGTSSLS
jgi:DNA-binding NtrC family response regulator